MTREEGFTLVEVTVLVAVIGVLVALLSGSAGDLLEQSRQVRAQQDVQRIAEAIAAFYTDNGFYPRTEDVVAGRPGDEEVAALMSDAPVPETTGEAAWWVRSRLDLMSEHLTRNGTGYRERAPGQTLGWAGPYLAGSVREDPWGAAYLVNVLYLDASGATLQSDGTPAGAVFVLSAGPNGIVETPFYQPRSDARLYGDDIGVRLQ